MNAKRKAKEEKELAVFIGRELNPICGVWVSLPYSEYELSKIVDKISHKGRYEVGIMDLECPDYLEYETLEGYDLEELNTLADDLLDLDDEQKEIIGVYLGECSNDIEEALEVVQGGEYTYYYDCYTMEEVANEYIEESGGLQGITKETLELYFDFDMFVEELKLDFNDNDEDLTDVEEYALDLFRDDCLSRETLEMYFDYEAYGRDIEIELHCARTSSGYIIFNH